MSTQRGNSHRKRSQKHCNTVAFKCDRYDTSKKTKEIKMTDVIGVCQRCKETIEWKIKYKKYKRMTQPKKCVRCGEKAVARSYYVACDACIQKFNICGKCNKENAEVVKPINPVNKDASNAEFERELKGLRERQRRTVMRYLEKGDTAQVAEKLKEVELTDSDSDECASEENEEVEDNT